LGKNDSFPLQVSYLKKKVFLDSCCKVTFPWTLKVAEDIFSRFWNFCYDYLVIWWVDCLMTVCWYYLLTTISLMYYFRLSLFLSTNHVLSLYSQYILIYYLKIYTYIYLFISIVNFCKSFISYPSQIFLQNTCPP
jgi:hypothetical protein